MRTEPHPDDFGIKQPVPAYIVQKDAHGRPVMGIARGAEYPEEDRHSQRKPIDLDQFEAALATMSKHPAPALTALEEIAAMVLELRWKELVDLGGELEKTEGTDHAARLWAWAHKTRGEAP